MSDQNNKSEQELDDIIELYVQSAQGPDYNTVRELADKYPQHADDIADFSMAWALVQAARPTPAEMAAEDVSESVERHLAAIRQLSGQKAGATLKGIIKEGQARGISTLQLARAAGLGVPLITKLDRRIIRFASIPVEVIESVARVLGQEIDTVARYLQGGTMLAPGASYKADEAPKVPGQEDFAQAVAADRTLSEDQRKHLLSLR